MTKEVRTIFARDKSGSIIRKQHQIQYGQAVRYIIDID